MNKFDKLYNELRQISKEILPYYDIDKIKSYSVYIWTKGDDSENVFDIQADRIVFYEEHEIIKEAKPIIAMMQEKLKEISACTEQIWD